MSLLQLGSKVVDYPRPCEETFLHSGSRRLLLALPPHLRGHNSNESDTEFDGRLTPAPAGKPSRWPAASTRIRAYPRTCGETLESNPSHSIRLGLPPPLGGTQTLPARRFARNRLTPAFAGNPFDDQVPRDILHGIPPHLRGNLKYEPNRLIYLRHTPASAGKPNTSR